MFQIVYLSTAVEMMSHEALSALLRESRANNEARSVTGMLLYHEGCFIQVLEGEEATLEELYLIISQDERHNGIIKLIEQSVAEREFPDWTMGFKMLSQNDYRSLMGYFNPRQNARLTTPEQQHDSDAVSLLKVFRATNIGL